MPHGKRAVILDAARDVFGERGINGTRMDDVADRAGIARPNLYRYFPSKDELIKRVVIAEVAKINAERRQRLPVEGSVRELIVESLAEGVERTDRDMLLAVAFADDTVGVTAELVATDDQLLGVELEYWRPILAHGRARGEIADHLSDEKIVRWFMTNHYFFMTSSTLFPADLRPWISDFIVPAVLQHGDVPSGDNEQKDHP
ncbi:TetR/AcrR family transcriptional regulator [Rhodococcus sp. JVH1]|uniref:TetR/AcrR family transcriptional regulator n=1 Tax=Rhodococcus sp. JVH1 TaxID=745408 RepID=UPI000271F905|nr:TetR/AcrR family transcriptional regulator [Rhodococcus sp. JVH1]EJI98436.1 transcriptional regulator, TetR family [Rhodococcus sp. JVH1]